MSGGTPELQQKLRIAFAGTPEFAAVALQALLESDHEVVVVLSQPDRPAGRGRQPQASAVKQAAAAAGVEIWQPVHLKDTDSQQQLASYNVDVMVVVAYGLLLPEPILSIPRLGCLNIHASLLPRWRGAAPIQRAILAGDRQTGICIMQMDAGLDTGAVLHQCKIPIDSDVTSGELHDELATLGAAGLLETLSGMIAGTIEATPQVESGAIYAHKLKKSEALLDFNSAAVQLHQQIMAFNPWPVAQTTFENQQLRIWRSELPGNPATLTLATSTSAMPGTVIEINADGVLLATGEGVLRLLQIQRPGKKPAAASDVARGMQLMDKVLG
ncbi:MAG: methionyl-tRNA formyltransferase [Granulosicoccaceae bacterium]